jgi:hypothetical protein
MMWRWLQDYRHTAIVAAVTLYLILLAKVVGL